MTIIIYGKAETEECSQCGAAKMLCQMKQKPYEYKIIGEESTPDQLTLMAGVPIRSAPAIFERNSKGSLNYIGGYQDLRQHLAKHP